MSTVAAPQERHSPDDNRFKWTIEAFYRASDAGVFDEPERWELVKGDLCKKEKVIPPHAVVTEAIAGAFRQSLGAPYKVREEKPVTLSADTEPMPDVAVVIARNYGARHPGVEDILLLVEVADASVYRDTTDKALLYAQAWIADYWVSLIPTREPMVFRLPTAEGYRERLRLADSDTVRPLFAPDMELAVSDLIVPNAGAKTA